MPHQFGVRTLKIHPYGRDGSEEGFSLDSQLLLTYQSVTELQQQLNLRTLEQRRVDAKVIMMFKNIHGLVAIPVPPYFEQQMRLTRHSHPLALLQIHTTANDYKFTFSPSTVVYWNNLPAKIELLPTLDQFSVAVRAHTHLIP